MLRRCGAGVVAVFALGVGVARDQAKVRAGIIDRLFVQRAVSFHERKPLILRFMSDLPSVSGSHGLGYGEVNGQGEYRGASGD